MAASSSTAATSMQAASSSTAVTSNYDVFLSHRGVDVKKTFASYLYRRLSLSGLKVFLDQPELQRGDYFAPQIEDAIRSASLHVAIFSAGYADSEWCLNEVLMMLDSKAPIIPVFYHVKPSELRWTLGNSSRYGEALERLANKTNYDTQTHEQKSRYGPSTIENWRNALSRVSEISGFELDAFNGDEGLLLEEVVEVVLRKVKKAALEVAKYPIGLDYKVNDLENTVLLQLQQSGKPQILGIVGLGGVGKTTLAKEFFNRKTPDYSKSCFLDDVRDNAQKGNLNSLQCKLLQSLTGVYNPIINSVAQGIGMLRMALSSSKALVILDDVDHVDQVDALLPIGTVLHPHSLIFITSRDKSVLRSSRVEESSLYILTGLDTQSSRELFCSHAFNQPYPLQGFEYLVQELVKTCDGFPLSMKVIGAFLYGKGKYEWEDELRSLQRTLPDDIRLRLKRSYDSLNRDEQKIFLDIACFFKGQNMDKTITIWNGLGLQGRRGFQILRNMCLAEVDRNNNIQMHDHLRDLGRDLAANPGLPCRLWRWTENTIDDLLQQPTKAVRGIRMVLGEYDDSLNGIHMGRLKLLDSEDVLVDRILTRVQSPKLIWLRWNKCPYSSLPSSISMSNLRVLEVQGMELRTLWENDSQAPLELQELQIESPLSFIPNSIGKLRHLKRLVIGLAGRGIPFPSRPPKPLACEGSSEMKSLEKSFANLTSPLCQCQHSDQCYALERLSNVSVSRRCPLERLPESFGNLTSLEHIQLSQCPALESLPDSFGNLINLQHLQLSGCFALNRLPDSIGNLTKLHHIQLYECSALDTLPDSIGNLTNLHHIQLYECSALDRLPDSIGNLTNLHHIQLYECSALERLPDSFGYLTNLHHIQLSKCYGLKRLPDSFCQLTNLRSLNLEDCFKLVMSRETLGGISTLERINLSGCCRIQRLPPQVAQQRSLKQLLLGVTNLRELPNTIGGASRLEVLEVGSSFLVTLPPSLCNLRNLKELQLCSCDRLICLPPSLGLLTQLIELTIVDCLLIKELPFIKEVEGESMNSSILPRLKRLQVSETGISEISFAESVCFNLRVLTITSCYDLEEVGTLPNRLIDLSFSNCHNLKELDKIYGLKKLQELDISGCRELEELPSIGTLVSLSKLDASGCVKLKSIRGFGQLTKFQHLLVEGCYELQELEGIHHCVSLWRLDVQECPQLRWSEGVVELLRQRNGFCLNGV